MKKALKIIALISVLSSFLLAACTQKSEKYYRFSDEDIYIENREVINFHDLPNGYLIIENDKDLEQARTDYVYFDELPDIHKILEDYSLDKYTYFIGTVSMDGDEEISLKALLIDKETNRIYTEDDYVRKDKNHPIDLVRFWVRYAIIEKDKIQGLDFSEQKKEIYGGE